MICLGTWDNLRVPPVPPLTPSLAWKFQGRGQARGEPRVGQTVVRIRSFKYPNNRFGHKHGEGFNSSLKGLLPPLHVFALSRTEQDGLVLGPHGSGHWQSGQR